MKRPLATACALLLTVTMPARAGESPSASTPPATPAAGTQDSTAHLAATPAAKPADDAATERWRIVREESVASFRVRVLGILPIGGEFARFDGAIVLDRAQRRARVEAIIEAGSIAMANDSHAQWAKSDEFFDAAKYPEIRFVSLPLPFATIAAGGTLRGELTLRGATREVAFALEPSDCDLRFMHRCTVRVSGSVARSAFGMVSRPRTLNDRVSLRFTIAAVPQT